MINHITTYEYNGNRQLIKASKTCYKKLDEIENETIYEYFLNGLLKRVIFYKYKDSVKSLLYSHEYEYNYLGQLSKRVVIDNEGLISKNLVYEYNDQGKVIKYSIQTPKGVVLSMTKTRYTKNGYKYINYKANGEYEKNEAFVVVECDSKGKEQLVTYYDENNKRTYWDENYYNSADVLIKKISYKSDGEIVFQEKYEYEDGLLKRKIELD